MLSGDSFLRRKKDLIPNFWKSFLKHNTQSSQVTMPTCQRGNQNRLQSLTKNTNLALRWPIARTQQPRRKRTRARTAKPTPSRTNTWQVRMSKSKIETSSKTKTEMGAAARVTTAPGPVLSCVHRLIEMVLLAHFEPFARNSRQVISYSPLCHCWLGGEHIANRQRALALDYPNIDIGHNIDLHTVRQLGLNICIVFDFGTTLNEVFCHRRKW